MRELNTIQKVEKLNRVYAVDEPGNGGANHEYMISRTIQFPNYETFNGTYQVPHCKSFNAIIQFQNGARRDLNATNGVLDTDLLEIVRDRLKGFQNGDFATDDNAKALEHIEIALMYMNKRVMERYERNVLGTYKK